MNAAAPGVWAPRATTVELVGPAGPRRMAPAGDGWFRSAGPLAPGTDYAFSLDGGEPRPDPRSPWQPAGVHGPSRTVDQDSFEWTDAGWRGFELCTAVLYELHVGTFTREGTFDGVVGKLDHLASLGVDAVELMPVAAFPGRHGWGYDGVALYAPHEPYGGPSGLARLVDACHARGLGVLIDVVYNHLGPSGNYLAEFGPYFTDRYRTPWGDAVNLDGPGCREVRRFLIDNALMWLRDYHADGLRLDAVHAIFDSSPVHFLEELALEVAALAEVEDRRFWVVAESETTDPRVVRPRQEGGYGLDAVWHDDFHHALHVALTGEHDGYYASFRGARDLSTVLEGGSVRGEPAPPTRLVAFSQNHDQVGNRARGERLVHLVGDQGARLAATLVLQSPFVPLLFMGEEWGASTPFQYFTDHDDPELARAVSAGRRREFEAFGWAPSDVPDPQDPATFERSKLRWEEIAEPPHRDLLDWYREFIRLRRQRRLNCRPD
jgi:maltooligosyltrehalose trehalohydrolase